jgi:hypothetical protein
LSGTVGQRQRSGGPTGMATSKEPGERLKRFAFLRWASVRLMLRRLCQKAK